MCIRTVQSGQRATARLTRGEHAAAVQSIHRLPVTPRHAPSRPQLVTSRTRHVPAAMTRRGVQRRVDALCRGPGPGLARTLVPDRPGTQRLDEALSGPVPGVRSCCPPPRRGSPAAAGRGGESPSLRPEPPPSEAGQPPRPPLRGYRPSLSLSPRLAAAARLSSLTEPRRAAAVPLPTPRRDGVRGAP